MSEQQIIDGCLEGHSWAQKTLYESYAPMMMSVCIRYVKNREVAQDVLQEGFVKVFTKMNTYTGSGRFGGWMRRIFVVTALEYLRNNKHLQFQTNIEDHEESIASSDPSILKHLSTDYLFKCITELPDGYRTIFNLFVIEGYSHKEIATMLNIEESTSRSQYLRARKALQLSIESLKKQEYAK